GEGLGQGNVPRAEEEPRRAQGLELPCEIQGEQECRDVAEEEGLGGEGGWMLEAEVEMASSRVLLSTLGHRYATVLVTDGDLRDIQAALWHGKPAVVIPTSPHQRDNAARLTHLGAGVTCQPPCHPEALLKAVVEAHHLSMRESALRAAAVLHEAGGVNRAADLLESELVIHAATRENRHRQEREAADQPHLRTPLTSPTQPLVGDQCTDPTTSPVVGDVGAQLHEDSGSSGRGDLESKGR
ncbi:unnamed protein product, partial [Discosporangium mesarthrocarpum]